MADTETDESGVANPAGVGLTQLASESGVVGVQVDQKESADDAKESAHKPQVSARISTVRGDKKFQKKVRRMERKFTVAERRICDSAEGGDGLDVYQMCAFLAKHTTFLPPELTDRLAKTGQALKKGARISTVFGKKGGVASDTDAIGDETPATDTPAVETPADHSEADSDYDFDGAAHLGAESGVLRSITMALETGTSEDGKQVRKTQILELSRTVEKKNRVLKRHYYWCIFKAMFVATVQVLALFSVSWEILDEEVGHYTDFCPRATLKFKTAKHGVLKYMTTGFTFFIGINVLQVIKSIKKQGFYAALYGRGENLLPDLVDGGWLLFGQSMNMIVLNGTVWTSYIVLYFSKAVLDMVMNSVALYFILELDDMVIGLGDYKQVERYLEHYSWNIAERADQWVRAEMKLLEEAEQTDLDGHKQNRLNVAKWLFDAINWFLTVAIITPVMYLTAFCSFFIVPLYMLWCK